MVEKEKRPGERNTGGNLVHETVWEFLGFSMTIQRVIGEEGVFIRSGEAIGEQVIIDPCTRTITIPIKFADKIVEVQPHK